MDFNGDDPNVAAALKARVRRPSGRSEASRHALSYKGSGRLRGKRAIITGGDSGIGRAVAREGVEESDDAKQAAALIEKAARPVRSEQVRGAWAVRPTITANRSTMLPRLASPTACAETPAP